MGQTTNHISPRSWQPPLCALIAYLLPYPLVSYVIDLLLRDRLPGSQLYLLQDYDRAFMDYSSSP